jgi:hypothetical protein
MSWKSRSDLNGLPKTFPGSFLEQVSGLGNAMQQVGYRLQIRRVIVSRQRRGTSEHLIELRIGETER